MNILLIEDEPKIASFIKQGLTENGYEVTVAYDGKTGYSSASGGDYQLIITDVMLPHINGLELVARLRQDGIGTPILMLTALGTLDDKVEGLGSGADDYLVKPFHFSELLARVGALTRRQPMLTKETDELRFADVAMERSSKTVIRAGKEIKLTAKEYALLELFLTHIGRVLSRAQIAERVWGQAFDTGSNVVDVYINYLRNKIEKGFEGKLIYTVVGMGYVMKEGK